MALKYLGRLARARQLAAGGNSNTEASVLKAGEAGFVTDTGDLRVGDGVTAFSALKSVRNHRRVRTTAVGLTMENNDEVLTVTGTTSTIVLPDATANSGRVVAISNKGSGSVTVTGAPTNGTTIVTNASQRYVSDGAAWWLY